MVPIISTDSLNMPAHQANTMHRIERPANENEIVINNQRISIQQKSLLNGGVYLNGEKILKTYDRPSIVGYYIYNGSAILFLRSASPDGSTMNNSIIVLKKNGNEFVKQDFGTGVKIKLISARNDEIEFSLASDNTIKARYYLYDFRNNRLICYETRMLNKNQPMVHIAYVGELFYITGKIIEKDVDGWSGRLKGYYLEMRHKKIFYGAGCLDRRHSQKILSLWPVPRNANQLIGYGETTYLVSYGCPLAGVTVNSIRHVEQTH